MPGVSGSLVSSTQVPINEFQLGFITNELHTTMKNIINSKHIQVYKNLSAVDVVKRSLKFVTHLVPIVSSNSGFV